MSTCIDDLALAESARFESRDGVSTNGRAGPELIDLTGDEPLTARQARDWSYTPQQRLTALHAVYPSSKETTLNRRLQKSLQVKPQRTFYSSHLQNSLHLRPLDRTKPNWENELELEDEASQCILEENKESDNALPRQKWTTLKEPKHRGRLLHPLTSTDHPSSFKSQEVNGSCISDWAWYPVLDAVGKFFSDVTTVSDPNLSSIAAAFMEMNPPKDPRQGRLPIRGPSSFCIESGLTNEWISQLTRLWSQYPSQMMLFIEKQMVVALREVRLGILDVAMPPPPWTFWRRPDTPVCGKATNNAFNPESSTSWEQEEIEDDGILSSTLVNDLTHRQSQFVVPERGIPLEPLDALALAVLHRVMRYWEVMQTKIRPLATIIDKLMSDSSKSEYFSMLVWIEQKPNENDAEKFDLSALDDGKNSSENPLFLDDSSSPSKKSSGSSSAANTTENTTATPSMSYYSHNAFTLPGEDVSLKFEWIFKLLFRTIILRHHSVRSCLRRACFTYRHLFSLEQPQEVQDMLRLMRFEEDVKKMDDMAWKWKFRLACHHYTTSSRISHSLKQYPILYSPLVLPLLSALKDPPQPSTGDTLSRRWPILTAQHLQAMIIKHPTTVNFTITALNNLSPSSKTGIEKEAKKVEMEEKSENSEAIDPFSGYSPLVNLDFPVPLPLEWKLLKDKALSHNRIVGVLQRARRKETIYFDLDELDELISRLPLPQTSHEESKPNEIEGTDDVTRDKEMDEGGEAEKKDNSDSLANKREDNNEKKEEEEDQSFGSPYYWKMESLRLRAFFQPPDAVSGSVSPKILSNILISRNVDLDMEWSDESDADYPEDEEDEDDVPFDEDEDAQNMGEEYEEDEEDVEGDFGEGDLANYKQRLKYLKRKEEFIEYDVDSDGEEEEWDERDYEDYEEDEYEYYDSEDEFVGDAEAFRREFEKSRIDPSMRVSSRQTAMEEPTTSSSLRTAVIQHAIKSWNRAQQQQNSKLQQRSQEEFHGHDSSEFEEKGKLSTISSILDREVKRFADRKALRAKRREKIRKMNQELDEEREESDNREAEHIGWGDMRRESDDDEYMGEEERGESPFPLFDTVPFDLSSIDWSKIDADLIAAVMEGSSREDLAKAIAKRLGISDSMLQYELAELIPNAVYREHSRDQGQRDSNNGKTKSSQISSSEASSSRPSQQASSSSSSVKSTSATKGPMRDDRKAVKDTQISQNISSTASSSASAASQPSNFKTSAQAILQSEGETPSLAQANAPRSKNSKKSSSTQVESFSSPFGGDSKSASSIPVPEAPPSISSPNSRMRIAIELRKERSGAGPRSLSQNFDSDDSDDLYKSDSDTSDALAYQDSEAMVTDLLYIPEPPSASKMPANNSPSQRHASSSSVSSETHSSKQGDTSKTSSGENGASSSTSQAPVNYPFSVAEKWHMIKSGDQYEGSSLYNLRTTTDLFVKRAPPAAKQETFSFVQRNLSPIPPQPIPGKVSSSANASQSASAKLKAASASVPKKLPSKATSSMNSSSSTPKRVQGAATASASAKKGSAKGSSAATTTYQTLTQSAKFKSANQNQSEATSQFYAPQEPERDPNAPAIDDASKSIDDLLAFIEGPTSSSAKGQGKGAKKKTAPVSAAATPAAPVTTSGPSPVAPTAPKKQTTVPAKQQQAEEKAGNAKKSSSPPIATQTAPISSKKEETVPKAPESEYPEFWGPDLSLLDQTAADKIGHETDGFQSILDQSITLHPVSPKVVTSIHPSQDSSQSLNKGKNKKTTKNLHPSAASSAAATPGSSARVLPVKFSLIANKCKGDGRNAFLKNGSVSNSEKTKEVQQPADASSSATQATQTQVASNANPSNHVSATQVDGQGKKKKNKKKK